MSAEEVENTPSRNAVFRDEEQKDGLLDGVPYHEIPVNYTRLMEVTTSCKTEPQRKHETQIPHLTVTGRVEPHACGLNDGLGSCVIL